MKPGTLIRWRYALKFEDVGAAGAVQLEAVRRRIAGELPESGFTVIDRRDPSPQVSRTLERLRQFLTLIGLTALLIGGVGVANAVSTFIDKRRKVIATMKSLGATSRTVLAIFLTQVVIVALIGILIGLVLGTTLPLLLDALYGDLVPIHAEMTVSAMSILSASVYGLAVALLFTLWPLGRVERVSASVLFRDEVAPERAWPRLWVIVATLAVAAALVGFALLTSDSKRIALYFCLGLTVLFAVFVGLGQAVTWAARRAPRPRWPELALALRNLGAPGGLTRSVVLSLGAGLSLLVAVALADASLVNELKGRLPAHSPDYFVLDVSPSDYPALTDLVHRDFPAAVLEEAPMLRGRIVRLAGKPVEAIKAPPEAQWVLNGDRGLSYSVDVPQGSKVVAGKWWAADYSGEPLVSFEVDLAEKLGLKLGDAVTVNVLGRNVTARIANLREVKWESLAINFVMVFSPNTLESAPNNYLVTISLPPGTTLWRRGAHHARTGARVPFDDGDPRARHPRCVQQGVRQGHAGGQDRRQRHVAGRRPGARRRARNRAAPPHPGGGHPEDARRNAPAHPHHALPRVLPARSRDGAVRGGARHGGVGARRHASDEYRVQLLGRSRRPGARRFRRARVRVRRGRHLGRFAGAGGAIPALGVKDF